MFENLKAMGAVAGLLKNRDALKQTAERVKATLAKARLVGVAGGGAVKATVDGQMKLLSVELSAALASSGDAKSREMAGLLVCEAVNSAMEQARMKLRDEITKETKALGLPPEMLGGLSDLL